MSETSKMAFRSFRGLQEARRGRREAPGREAPSLSTGAEGGSGGGEVPQSVPHALEDDPALRAF